MTVRQICQWWNNFWFEERSPAPICLYRLIFGLLTLICGLLWAPDLLTWFGPRGVVSIATMHGYQHGPRFSLLYILPPTDQTVWALYALFLIASLFTALGFFTRTSLITLFVLLVSFHHRNVAIFNSGDTLLRVTCFILIFSPAGEMFSLDRLLRVKRGLAPQDPWQVRSSIWTVRLMQLQLAAVYCQTFFAKVVGDTWWNGTAVYYASRLEEFAHLPVPFLLDHMLTIKLLTWGTLGLELALWTLVWIKEFRYPVLLAGVMLHLGLDWTMNIPLFEYIIMACFLSFVDPDDIKRVFEFVKVRLKGSNLVAGQA